MALALTLVVATACGSSKTAQHAGTTTVASTTTAGTAATTTTVTSLPPCTSAALLPVIIAQLPRAENVKLTGVAHLQCKGGYARLLAVADNSTCGKPGGSCYQSEQVFLKAVDGHWQYLTNGSGINCTDPATELKPPELLQACQALGLR
jgi:hypothetical protein